MGVLYRDHFEFTIDPFGITPDTEFFFGGGQRADILEALTVTILHDEGIVMVVGEIGMGKTMLSRMLLDRLKAMPVDTVYLPNPVFDANEILHAIARDLAAAPPQGSRAEVLGVLEPILIERHSQGRRVVVVIDEAHSMPAATLEEIRLLSNLETSQHKLLKIVMFGQPELEQLLRATHLRQVRDRVSHRFNLRPLTESEVADYLDFRLQRAGRNRGQLFALEAQRLLAAASGGRTRRVNMLADKSLLAAFAAGSDVVLLQHARAACAEEAALGGSMPEATSTFVLPASAPSPRQWPGPAAAAVVLGLAGLGAGWWLGRGSAPAPVPPAAAAPAPAPAPAEAGSGERLSEARPTPPPAPQPLSAAPAAQAPASGLAAASAELPLAAKPLAAQPRAADEPRALTLAQRMSETEAVIAKGLPGGYTIQVLALKAPQLDQLQASIERFEKELGGRQPVLVNDRIYGGQRHHAVYIGAYSSRKEAQSALDALPATLKERNPLIRSFARLAKEPVP